MRQEHQIVFGHRAATRDDRVRAQDAERVLPAPIRYDDLLARQLAPDLRDRLEDRAGHRDCRRRRAQLVQLRKLQRRARALGTAGHHADEAVLLGDVVGHETEHEAIVKCGQLVLVGKLVRRAEHRDERHGDALAAVVENSFVDNRQQRVEDRRVGLEDFVEERDVRLGQFVRGDAPVIVFFESLQADRAENFFGVLNFVSSH